MYKLMIVDDEPNIVEGIRDSIPWKDYGVTVSDFAFSGRQALLKCTENPPDIIVTDIKMPEMDGLEFLEKARGIAPDAQVIVISAFEQFNYARQAIELGVRSYLIKPIKPADIIDKVSACVRELDRIAGERNDAEAIRHMYEQSKSLETAHALNCWIAGVDPSVLRLESLLRRDGLDLDARAFGIFAYVLLDENGVRILGQARERMLELISLNLPPDFTVLYFHSYRGEFAALFAVNLTEESVKNSLDEMLRMIEDAVSSEYNARFYYSIGDLQPDLDSCAISYREVLAGLDERMLSSRIVTSQDIDAKNKLLADNDQLFGLVPELLARYRQCLITGDSEEARLLEAELYENLIKTRPALGSAKIIYHQMLSINLEIIIENSIPLNEITATGGDAYERLNRQTSIESLHEWFIGIQAGLFALIDRSSGDICRRIVRTARQYIDSRPLGTVSLGDVSEHVSLSPSYFSKLFKKEMGVSFIDYMKNIRIEHAKYLLRHTNKKVYEICDELGYQSVQYFTTLFKLSTGMTALEYRQGIPGRQETDEE